MYIKLVYINFYFSIYLTSWPQIHYKTGSDPDPQLPSLQLWGVRCSLPPLILGDAGDQTRGFKYARQALYQLNPNPDPNLPFGYISDRRRSWELWPASLTQRWWLWTSLFRVVLDQGLGLKTGFRFVCPSESQVKPQSPELCNEF